MNYPNKDSISPSVASPSAYMSALLERTDLHAYGSNDLVLFALEMYFRIEDIHVVAVDSLTDGFNDKKCDLLYIDLEIRTAVIAQCYKANNPQSRTAPANKASDLNTAVSWIFAQDDDHLPEKLANTSKALREAISEGKIDDIIIWYVHNLEESNNVEIELRRVEETTLEKSSAISDRTSIRVRAHEIGARRLEEFYQSTQTAILVDQKFEFSDVQSMKTTGQGWVAYSTSIPGSVIAGIYKQHQEKLFSANVRGYLGSRNSDKNINTSIKDTAENNPSNFWAFNNGITAICNNVEKVEYENTQNLIVHGLAIVNGAQTTGALGSVDSVISDELLLPVRFIKCSNPSIVQDIVRFNNSQNALEASDFRSNDRVQQRLRREFKDIPDTNYSGGRRGGSSDAIKRSPNQIYSLTSGQVLAAFHGKPHVAYNRKSDIWTKNKLYEFVYNDSTTARHILFCYSCFQSIVEFQKNISNKKNENLTQSEIKAKTFFAQRGSHFALLYAIGRCIETLVDDGNIPNAMKVQFSDEKMNLRTAIDTWSPIVSVMVQFSHLLGAKVSKWLSKPEDSVEVENFVSMISTNQECFEQKFSKFSRSVSR